jgi:hypothetical protein
MLERASASPSMVRAIATAGMEADIREVLAAITSPTVVVMTKMDHSPKASSDTSQISCFSASANLD